MVKIVAFTPTASVDLTAYVANQLQSLAETFPDIEFEQTNELDSRIQYAWYPNRFPAFIIFVEPGVRLAALHAKVSTNDLVSWINSNLR